VTSTEPSVASAARGLPKWLAARPQPAPTGAALVAGTSVDGLTGVRNVFANLSNLLGRLPGGPIADLIEGAVLLARRQLSAERLASPAASGVAAGLALPIPPVVPGMVRDLAVAATGAQQLTLSWKAPTATAGTPTGYMVILETTPIDPSKDPGIQKISTTNESLTFAVNSTDKFVFSVAPDYGSKSGPARTVAYSATDSFLALTSFLSHPTAMLTARDGSMWIAYQQSLVDYVAKRALKCLGGPFCNLVFAVIPGAHWVRKEYKSLPDEVKRVIASIADQPPPPPQVRQYVYADGQWRVQSEILTGGPRPRSLAEDTAGNIWVASATGGFSGILGALFPNVKNNTGVVQRIADVSGNLQFADTLELAGAPMQGALAAAPDGGVWVGLDVRHRLRPNLRRAKNGAVQAIYRTAAGTWTADTNPFELRHPPTGLTVSQTGIIWATDTLTSGNGLFSYFGFDPNNLNLKTTLTRIDPVTGRRDKTNVGRGGQGVIAIPGHDSVLVATHDSWLTASSGGGEVKKIDYANGKFDTSQINLDAAWFGVPASQFRLQPDAGRPDSFALAPDGSILVAGRGASGQLRTNLFAGGLDYLLGPLGTVLTKVIRYSWELRSLVCEVKDCRFAPPIKYPDFKGSPAFTAQVWTPERGLVATTPVKYTTIPARQVSGGTVAPIAAPIQRGIWVDAGGAPLLIPMTPGTPVGLDATAGSAPEQVRLDWTPTVADGGTPVVSYTATVNTGLQRRTIPVGYYAYYGGMGLALSPDARRAYVANAIGFSVSLVDTVSGAVTATADLADPADVAVSPDGKKVYATNFFENSVSVLDAVTGAVTGTVGGFDLPFAVAVSTLGDRYYVADLNRGVAVVDSATNKVIKTIDVGTPAGEPTAGASNVVASPFSAQPVYAASRDGGFVSVINPVTNTVTNTLSLDGRPDGLAVSALGDYLYVASSMANEVWAFHNPGSSKPTLTTLRGFDGPTGVAVSADGTRLYVTNSAAGTVSVLSVGPTGGNTVIATLDVGDNPKDVAISPDGTRLFVVGDSGLSEYVLPSQSQTVAIPAAPTSTTFDHLMCGPGGGCDLGTTYFTVSGTNFVGSGTDRNGNITSAGLWLAADGTPLSTEHLGVGVGRYGQTVYNGGFDTYGYAYSWEALGGTPGSSPIAVSLAWDGATFDLGSPNQPDFTRFEGQTIPVRVGVQTSALKLVGAAVNGNHPDVTMTLNYSDGTSEAWTQSFSDWVNPQHYANETVIATPSQRYSQSGATDYTPTYVYGYSHPIPAGKQVVSITVPNDPYVRLLGIQ
jgi:YVTN family beta-propeller protein